MSKDNLSIVEVLPYSNSINGLNVPLYVNSVHLETCPLSSPIGGLSDSLYAKLVSGAEEKAWSKSPIGGLSLPEFLRLIG
jgi:hypothetical protein